MARIKPQALLIQSKKKKTPTRISLTAIITCNLIVFLIVLSVYATYKYWYRRPSYQPDIDYNTIEHSGALGQQKKFDLPSYAILNTAKGSITAELFKDASPEVVDKFIDLCQKGHFKGMPFRRVIKHYVIQGGDFQELGTAEDWTLKGKANSKSLSPKHEAFMLGTAKAKPDKKGFELFITTAPIPDLNDKLVVFGRVVKGEDVVQLINKIKSKLGRIQIQVNSWHGIRNKVASAEVPLPSEDCHRNLSWESRSHTGFQCTQIGSLDSKEAEEAGSGLGPCRAPTVNLSTSINKKMMMMMAGPLVSISCKRCGLRSFIELEIEKILLPVIQINTEQCF